MKIYTKGGDKGKTSLYGGERVAKFDSRVEAYGTIDELMTFLALFADKMRGEELTAEYVSDIDRVNCILMSIGGLFAAGEGMQRDVPPSIANGTQFLEQRIDLFCEELPKKFCFTMPGGLELASLAQVCRTITRRAERRALEADQEHNFPSEALVFINRLSDYLYTLGRILTIRYGAEEILWQSH